MNVFLDLDGPILDNREKYYRLYRDLLREIPCQPLTCVKYWSLKQDRTPEDEILRRSAVPEDRRREYFEARTKQIESVDYLSLDRVWPGVPAWLKRCRAANPTYLVTMRKRREELLTQLEQFQLLPFFQDVLSVDNNDGNWQVKYRLMKSCLTDGDASVIIGDTEADIEAGHQLEILTIAVRSGIRNDSHLADTRPHLIVDSLVDVDLDAVTHVEQR